ncbi:hypothetical protein B0H10DRAFT_1775133, partial [Mycena sp. CBHHK59/15]
IQCERLAAETKFWLMIAGSHRAAATEELHYASEALRGDAPESITNILNQFRLLIGGLKKARRTTAITMGIALSKAEDERDKAVKKTQEAELLLAQQQQQLELQAELLARYQKNPSSPSPSADIETRTVIETINRL